MDSFEIEFAGLPGRACRVAFGRALFPEAACYLAERNPVAVPVISDEKVAGLYGERLAGALAAEGVASLPVTFPPGESNKSWATLGSILERLVDAAPGRGAIVAALGGGVTGDLAPLFDGHFDTGLGVDAEGFIRAGNDQSRGDLEGIAGANRHTA